jgi:hypothetical protein
MLDGFATTVFNSVVVVVVVATVLILITDCSGFIADCGEDLPSNLLLGLLLLLLVRGR